MAEKINKMGIQYAYPLESISRKFTLRKNTASDTTKVNIAGNKVTLKKSVSKFIGGATRQKFVKGLGYVTKNYAFIRFNKRDSAPTEGEQEARRIFGVCAQAVRAWKKDVAHLTDMQRAWNENITVKGVTTAGKTNYQYLFQIAYAMVENDEDVAHFPSING